MSGGRPGDRRSTKADLEVWPVDDPATMAQTSTPTDGPSIYDMIEQDLRKREQVGIEKYGTTLQGGNGRRSLVDAYQEALDLACYLRCELETRRLDYERGVADGQAKLRGDA